MGAVDDVYAVVRCRLYGCGCSEDDSVFESTLTSMLAHSAQLSSNLAPARARTYVRARTSIAQLEVSSAQTMAAQSHSQPQSQPCAERFAWPVAAHDSEVCVVYCDKRELPSGDQLGGDQRTKWKQTISEMSWDQLSWAN